MIKHFISVEIVDHRLVGAPHVLRVSGRRAARPTASRAIEPLRGIAIGAMLSVMLWAMLIVAVARPFGADGDGASGAADRRIETAACTGAVEAPCRTSPAG